MYDGEDQAEGEQEFAEVIRELTGDWFEEIKCEDIQADERVFYDEVVYFGDAEDLTSEEYGGMLQSMSMVDRYQYDQHRVGFYYNTDPKCREENELDPEKKQVAFFNGENSIPVHLTFGEDAIDFNQLMYTLNTSINKGTPRWSQRSYSVLFDFYSNGLIFLMEEGALVQADTVKDDWRAALMAKTTEWI